MNISNGIGLLAGMLAAGMAMARADTPLAVIAIGDVTFNHSPTSWRIERNGDVLVATCVQQDCRDVVIDISRREGEAGCTKEAMKAEAERLFPVQGRAYANIIRSGRFALVLAERHDGPDLSSPEFAYGCLVWQGYEYRFAMRPETVGSQSWVGGALIYLVSMASAPEAPFQEVRLGDVTFRVSTQQWTIPDVAGETVRLTCRMPTCHEPGLWAVLSVHSPEAPCPEPAPDDEFLYGGEARHGAVPKDAPDGLDFVTTETWLGCRNYVPPRFAACAVHNGRSYHLSTLGPQSCRSSIWSIPENVLAELLSSARIVE